MQEIKIGEYIRTKKGNIGKVLDITTCTGQKRKKYLIKWNIVKAYYITGTTIVKHSPNIIDLIQVGDYVNGNIVYEILDDEIELLSGKIRKKRIHFITGHLIDEEEIKSIVTHEQFAEMEYRV